MKFGKQVYFCPNCGKRHYAASVHDKAMALAYTCSLECMKEWEVKRTRFILGMDQEVGDGDDTRPTP